MGVVAIHNLILDFKTKVFKRFHRNAGIIQFGGSTKLSAAGIDYHMVIFYKFGNVEEKA